MTTAEIDAFIAICQEMSISKAAERLYISQSSLSTKIKTLEKELGYNLFIRGRGQRNLNLTDEGKEFYELSLKYKEIVDNMMSLGQKKEFSHLVISTVNSMGNFLFAPAYEMFMEKNPGVSLKIQDQDTYIAYDSLAKGQTDLAFTISRRDYPGISSYPVFGEPMALICSRGVELPDVVQFKDLDISNEIYVPWTETFMDWHDIAFGSADNAQIKLEIMSQLYYFLAKGNSWAIVPSSVASYMTSDSSIVRKELGFDVPMRMGICAFVDDKSKKKLIDSFLECIKDVLKSRTDCEMEIFI